MKIETVIVEWAEVRKAFLDGLREGKFLSSKQPIYYKQHQWHAKPTRKSGFEGGSAYDTGQWLDNGFWAPAFAHSAEHALIAERRRFRMDEEEGELDVDLVLGGYDKVFLDHELRESRPGLRLMFEFAFVHDTPVKVISQYGAWCASLLTSLESSGYDMVVDMLIRLDNLFVSKTYDTRQHVLIRVKNENEKSNFTAWSALFAPTGYRQLGFLAKCIAAEKVGKRVTGGFGTTIGGQDWDVSYDREQAQVIVHVNQRARGQYFPVEKLNEAAMREGLIPRPIKVSDE